MHTDAHTKEEHKNSLSERENESEFSQIYLLFQVQNTGASEFQVSYIDRGLNLQHPNGRLWAVM